MGKYIDMHIHSKNSDGDLSVLEIVERAKQLNLGIIAITDHDDVRSINEVKKCDLGDVGFVSGVELSSKINAFGIEKNIDVLGYGINGDNDRLRSIIEKQKNIRYNSNRTYLVNMLKEFSFLDSDILYEIDCSRYIRFSRLIYRYLNDKKFSKNELVLINNYLKSNSFMYPGYNLEVGESIQIITNAGGYPVIAHPYQYRLSLTQTKCLIQYMKELGLVGIETIHSGDSYEGMKIMNKLCEELGLDYTIGSDFHTDYNDYGRQIGYGVNNNLCVESCSLLKKIEKNNKVYRG